MEDTHIGVYGHDKEELERLKEDKGFRTMAQLIHWILYVDTHKTSSYSQLEMENRKLKREIEELRG